MTTSVFWCCGWVDELKSNRSCAVVAIGWNSVVGIGTVWTIETAMLSLMIEVLIHHPTESHTKVVASNLGFLEPPSVLSSGSLVFSHSVNPRDQCFWCFWSGWMLIASFIGRIYAPGGLVFFPSFCFPIWNYWDDCDRIWPVRHFVEIRRPKGREVPIPKGPFSDVPVIRQEVCQTWLGTWIWLHTRYSRLCTHLSSTH